MRVRGLVFAGVSSVEAGALARFLAELLEVEPTARDGVWRFPLPDGGSLAVVGEPHTGSSSDTILGLLVDDVESAREELAARGIEVVGGVSSGGGWRWQKLRAPDGRLVELVDRVTPPAGAP